MSSLKNFPDLLAMHMSSVVQSCLTLCDPLDCSTPDSSVHGIFQARILEWGAIPFTRNNSNSDTYRGLCCSSCYILYILCLIWYSQRVFMVRLFKNFLKNNVISLKYCWFYNAVLIFAVQQSDSVLYICVCVLVAQSTPTLRPHGL